VNQIIEKRTVIETIFNMLHKHFFKSHAPNTDSVFPLKDFAKVFAATIAFGSRK